MVTAMEMNRYARYVCRTYMAGGPPRVSTSGLNVFKYRVPQARGRVKGFFERVQYWPPWRGPRGPRRSRRFRAPRWQQVLLHLAEGGSRQRLDPDERAR